MLVDSFNKNHYAPSSSFETKSDNRQLNFKNILQRNAVEAKSQNNGISDNPNNINKSINEQTQKVHLGKLSDDTPTVSELLYNTPYKKHCWKMLESDVNSSKRFKRIPEGTDIYLDKSTSEIIWERNSEGLNSERERLNFKKRVDAKNYSYTGLNSSEISIKKYQPNVYTFNADNSNAAYKTENSNSAYNAKNFKAVYKVENSNYSQPDFDPIIRFKYSSRKYDNKSKIELHEAVKEFIGKDYDKIDCYELVVNGLEKIGVKYAGENGLGRHLIDKAIEEGLSQNHYLTGEGLVEATGHSVYSKRILNVKNPISQAKSAMQEMENLLKEGQILSFSTRTRGHTGIISKKNGVWTFINSGYMDNNIAGKNGKKQVGEEILLKELENWFKLAGKKKDGLMITLGDIDSYKLATFIQNNNNLSEKV